MRGQARKVESWEDGGGEGVNKSRLLCKVFVVLPVTSHYVFFFFAFVSVGLAVRVGGVGSRLG